MNKLVLLATAALILLSPGVIIPHAFATHVDTYAFPLYHAVSPASNTVVGLTPTQIRHAYGFDGLSCSSSNTCGSGQTVAIVDAFNDPNIQSDLNTFDSAFGLPTCTTSNGCFTIATPQGAPRTDRGWALEISLDVEWAHAIAPGAKILLVEAATNSFANLFGAVDYAKTHAQYVSNSWGASEFSSETSYDVHFAQSGVSFFVSSGDGGLPADYPSASPNVISVGGTTLHFDSSGVFTLETGSSSGGGGCSTYEAATSAQASFAQ